MTVGREYSWTAGRTRCRVHDGNGLPGGVSTDEFHDDNATNFLYRASGREIKWLDTRAILDPTRLGGGFRESKKKKKIQLIRINDEGVEN